GRGAESPDQPLPVRNAPSRDIPAARGRLECLARRCVMCLTGHASGCGSSVNERSACNIPEGITIYPSVDNLDDQPLHRRDELSDDLVLLAAPKGVVPDRYPAQ